MPADNPAPQILYRASSDFGCNTTANDFLPCLARGTHAEDTGLAFSFVLPKPVPVMGRADERNRAAFRIPHQHLPSANGARSQSSTTLQGGNAYECTW
jgi:hypothetical protein